MYKLLAYQILAHLSIIYAIVFFDLYLFLASLFVYFLMISIGISAGFHRLVSHRGYESPKWFKTISLLIGTLGLNASALVWGAMHREHHAYSDTEDDPHSPSFSGILKTYFGVVLYQPKLKFAKDLLRDKLVIFFHKQYFKINVGYDIILAVINPELIIWLHLLPATILWHATAAINVFSHLPTFGYRTYETGEESRNSHLLSFLIAGEGYHNNHHKDPKNINFAHSKNEFDITGWIVKKIKL
jgi:stearoyl-CoA desaturase (delta-9 desaturase)|tara:strand:+ start:921 stop:1649 length:729 start_codon:yes stop_codon:yes gene_type:complete